MRVLFGVQTCMIILTVIIAAGIVGIEGGTDTNLLFIEASRIYLITTFSVFLVVYIIVLYLLTTRLKRYFPKFYLKERNKIFTSNGVIILSIVSRISMNIFVFFNQHELDLSYNEGTWFFPLYQLFSCFFSSLFPLAAIIVSLMYAINHKTRMVNFSQRRSKRLSKKYLHNS